MADLVLMLNLYIDGAIDVFVALSTLPGAQQLQKSYAKAYTESLAEKKTLVVVVGPPWRPACQVLKESTLKLMAKTGELDDVSFVVINRDETPRLLPS
jgi:thiol-disulfide isomerase/thioredoxin